MSRGAHRREAHVQAVPPTPPSATLDGGPEPDGVSSPEPAPAEPLSPGWGLVSYLWVTAFAALVLFELFSALFRR